MPEYGSVAARVRQGSDRPRRTGSRGREISQCIPHPSPRAGWEAVTEGDGASETEQDARLSRADPGDSDTSEP